MREKRSSKDSICIVNGCSAKATIRGYCDRHYAQILRCGRITPDLGNGYMMCKTYGCTNKASISGLCNKHYTQMKKYGKTFK